MMSPVVQFAKHPMNYLEFPKFTFCYHPALVRFINVLLRVLLKV